ncbi:MAG: inositol monophosphatase, partial [Muribaculaceae bacterium]|nr:inositol monophosphatase [Muribaculaceae bacterium]
MNVPDIDTLLNHATEWAREAGLVQLEYFRSNNLNIESKFNDSDIVTAADKASERIIIDH